MTLALRPYQIDLIERTRAAMRSGVRRVLIQAPTGAGKTVLIAQMIAGAAAKDKRAYFIVHRRELVQQSAATLMDSAGVVPGIVAAGTGSDYANPVQVCMVQSLARRLQHLAPPDLLIFDEAHHNAAKTWSDITDAWPGAVRIGLTATPIRLDGKGLRKYFDEIVLGPSIRTLIDEGFLSDFRIYAPNKPDLSGVHTVAGDYNPSELADVLEKSTIVGDALAEYQRRAAGKRALVFAWSLDASRAIAARFSAAWIASEHVDGDTPRDKRDAAMARFRAGETLVLCNVGLFGEGVDVPALECVIMMRPTKSLGMYMQQVGRALRPCAGKTHAIILDHAGNVHHHGMPDEERAWTLDGVEKRASKTTTKECPACFATVKISAQVCPYCGFSFAAAKKPREMEHTDGELVELDAVATRAKKTRELKNARTLPDLIRLGISRGYKYPIQWANHVFRERGNFVVQQKWRRG